MRPVVSRLPFLRKRGPSEPCVLCNMRFLLDLDIQIQPLQRQIECPKQNTPIALFAIILKPIESVNCVSIIIFMNNLLLRSISQLRLGQVGIYRML